MHWEATLQPTSADRPATNTATKSTLAASNAVVATPLCGTSATLTVSAAAPNNKSDQTGIFGSGAAPLGSTRPAGSTIGTSAAIAAVSIATAPNAQRHSPNWAKKPPVAGPIIVATPHIADTSAEARVHNACGRAALITA